MEKKIMSYTKNEGIESLRRSLLLMSYDSKKTLSENVEEILSEQTNLESLMIDLRKAVYGGGTNEKLLIQAINKLTSKAEYDALNKEIRNNPSYFAMGTALGGGPKNLQDILNGDLGRDNVYTAQEIQKKLATIGINMTFKSYNYGGVPAGTAGKYLTPNSITIGGAASGGKTGTGAASGGKTGAGAASGGKTGRRSKYIPIGKNDCVIKIQTFLKGQGFTLGPKDVDGVYGSFTIRAVQEYQRKNGLTPDGIWGPATAAKTGNQIPPCGVAQTDNSQTGTTTGTTTDNRPQDQFTQMTPISVGVVPGGSGEQQIKAREPLVIEPTQIYLTREFCRNLYSFIETNDQQKSGKTATPKQLADVERCLQQYDIFRLNALKIRNRYGYTMSGGDKGIR